MKESKICFIIVDVFAPLHVLSTDCTTTDSPHRRRIGAIKITTIKPHNEAGIFNITQNGILAVALCSVTDNCCKLVSFGDCLGGQENRISFSSIAFLLCQLPQQFPTKLLPRLNTRLPADDLLKLQAWKVSKRHPNLRA